MKRNLFLFVVLLLITAFAVSMFSESVSAEWKNCPQYTSQGQNACTTAGCNWKTDSYYGGQFCGDFFCEDADNTNLTFCQTTANTLYNVSCQWSAGSSLCDPLGGDFFGDGCSDLTTTTACYDSFFVSGIQLQVLATNQMKDLLSTVQVYKILAVQLLPPKVSVQIYPVVVGLE